MVACLLCSYTRTTGDSASWVPDKCLNETAGGSGWFLCSLKQLYKERAMILERFQPRSLIDISAVSTKMKTMRLVEQTYHSSIPEYTG
jgi:hypothetical protein